MFRFARFTRRARSRPRLRIPLAIAAILACAVPALAQDYPRLGLYGRMYGDGYPLWDSTGTFDEAALDDISRYNEVILDAHPITEYRPDAIAALRQRHPGIRLLAYVTGHMIWYQAAPDSAVQYPTRYWNTVRNLDGFLYNTRGDQYGYLSGAFANVNIAKRDVAGNYVVAEAIARLFYDAIVSTGLWDGLFVDTYCYDISWTQTAADSIDYLRAGYPSIAAFNAGWRAGTDTLASRLRQLSGSTEILVGNCLPGTKYAWFNGWMVENFPFQNGGTWDENMFNARTGYFASEANYRAPRYNHLFSAAFSLDNPYTAENMRKVRFGLGTASLGEGYGVFGFSARDNRVYPYDRWWYDEYAVDRSTGRSSVSVKDIGWLGQPLGPWFKMVWPGDTPNVVTNPGFETDVSGWIYRFERPATFVSDPVNPAVGAASAKITIAVADTVPWAASIWPDKSLTLSYGQLCSGTFWARSATPRRIVVVATSPLGGEMAHGVVDLTTAWKQYQVAFFPKGSGESFLQFYFGDVAGDVWFDDVHWQLGASSVYRRDFQHGIILVNPTFFDLQVPLAGKYQKIRGIRDLVNNDGSYGDRFVVHASDALFLLGADQVKPASVIDLHVVH